jgi:hypothetical protein
MHVSAKQQHPGFEEQGRRDGAKKGMARGALNKAFKAIRPLQSAFMHRLAHRQKVWLTTVVLVRNAHTARTSMARSWPTFMLQPTPLRHSPLHAKPPPRAATTLLSLPSMHPLRCQNHPRRVRCTVLTPQPTRRHGTRPRPAWSSAAGQARHLFAPLANERAHEMHAKHVCSFRLSAFADVVDCLDGIFLRGED